MDYVCLLSNGNKDVLGGKELIKDLETLYVVISDLDTQVVDIRSDFFEKYFTETGFTEFQISARKLNPYIDIRTDKDITTKYNKMALELSKFNNVEEIVNFFLHNKQEGPRLLQHLCTHYSSTYQEAISANNKLSTVHLELLEAKNDLNREKRVRERLEEKHNITHMKLDTLVKRINYQYEKDINLDKMTDIYVESPMYKKVLYIKELTRVHYTDTFVYYLQEVLRTLYGLPARLVVIEAPYAYSRINMYQGCKPHTNLTFNDVYSEDIFMAGFQYRLMEDILRNPSRLEYLIILDRGGWETPHVYGKGIETLYTISDTKDLNFDVDKTRLITYRSDTLSIPHIQGFDELTLEEKLAKFSSMEILKSVLQLLER